MTKKKNKGTSHGQKATKVASRSYTPISDALSQPNILADNEFSEAFKRTNLASLLTSCINKERRSDAVDLSQIAMSLLIWPILKLRSVHCFCSELCHYLEYKEGKPKHPAEILYSFWGREDINWRKFAQKVTRKISISLGFHSDPKTCFVIDDTLKARRGKKVEGSSYHYDHNSGKTLQGHQLLELGLVGEKGFLPLDRQIYMGSKNAITKEFSDKRSASARDMKRAEEEDKNTMLQRMLKKAVKDGYQARYVLADSWFGNKGNIETVSDLGIHSIFQMKRTKQKYRIGDKDYTAQELYTKYHRKLQSTSKDGLYKTLKIEAEINLETAQNKPARWKAVLLILSAPKRQDSTNWVIFLCTDLNLNAEEVLSIYAQRWSIEVYFKEAKQSFGLLAEQSGKYQVAYASVHLASVRYMLIYESMQNKGAISFGQQRDCISGQLQILTYSGLLWQLFRFLITGALEKMSGLSQDLVRNILEALDQTVEEFLSNAFDLDLEPKIC